MSWLKLILFGEKREKRLFISTVKNYYTLLLEKKRRN